MRIWLGIVTLTGGVAALAMWLAPSSVESGLSVVSDIGAGGVASLSSSRDTSGRDKAGASRNDPAIADAEGRFFGSALPATTARPSSTDAKPASTAAARTWTTDVVIYPGARGQGSDLAAPARVVASSGVNAPRNQPRQEIARALQAELKRIGCYAGDIDGEWGPGSRRSLRAFIEQANSGLSSDEPELIHLTLARGYSGIACRSGPAQPNGATTATRTAPPVFAPTIAPVRPPFAPSSPVFATSPAAAPAPASVVAGTTDSPASSSLRPGNFEGRMTVGAPLPADAAQSGAVPLTAAPGLPAAHPRPQRPRTTQRRDPSWTRNFFNQ